jgi:hypothetical protein
MKPLFSILVGVTGALAIANGAIAQSRTIATTEIAPSTQSELLTTQPLISRETPVSMHGSVYDPDRLQGIAAAVQSGAVKPAAPSFTDWIYTTPDRTSDANPIGFFQVPGPARSVGINIKN